jgi:membrane protein YdbS with pleckstrin-like domain
MRVAGSEHRLLVPPPKSPSAKNAPANTVWAWIAVAIVFVSAVILVLLTSDKNWPQYITGGIACGVILALIIYPIASRVAFPFQMRGYSAERNTIRLRFRNPAYLKAFLVVNHLS